MTDAVAAPSKSHAGLRRDAGFDVPMWDDKVLIWSRVTSPTALIAEERGGYVPGPTAAKAHRSDARAVGISGGAGAGKSLWLGMEGVTHVPFSSLIWIIAKGYQRARAEFQYLSEAAVSAGLARKADVHLPPDKDKQCTLISKPHASTFGEVRCEVQTITVRDYQEQLTMRRPDLIMICEPGLIEELADMEATIWGRLAERRGKLLAAGTSEESSEDWVSLLDEWQKPDNPFGGEVFQLPTYENTATFPLGEADPMFVAFRQKFGEELYQMRFGGVPARPRDLVLKGYWHDSLIDDELEFDPSLPLAIHIDPNYLEPARYAIGFVQWDDQTGDVNLIDEITAEGKTHPEMIRLFQAHELSRYVDDLESIIDPHSGDHHANGNESPLSYWQEVLPGLGNNEGKQIPVDRTVQAIKVMMADRPHAVRPRLRVSRRCERFAFETRRWKVTAQGVPRKTYCDMLKGFGYWAVRKLAQEKLASRGADDNTIRAGDYGWGTGYRSRAVNDYAREYERIYGEPLEV